MSIDYQLGDPDKTLGELELTAKDKKIIKKGDVRAMFDMGVHPFLLNHLSATSCSVSAARTICRECVASRSRLTESRKVLSPRSFAARRSLMTHTHLHPERPQQGSRAYGQ